MIAIIDYGVGNLFSLSASLSHLNIENTLTKDPKIIEEANHLILPGVGAFGDASKQLFDSGLAEIVKEQSQRKPLMGICLGMQLLFETGHEFGKHSGLGLIPGEVVAIPENSQLKIPHMGWNSLQLQKKSPLFAELTEGDAVYFVHSFYAKTEEKYISSVAEYGINLTASVENGQIFGCQFHPEKSGKVGLSILNSFSKIESNR